MNQLIYSIINQSSSSQNLYAVNLCFQSTCVRRACCPLPTPADQFSDGQQSDHLQQLQQYHAVQQQQHSDGDGERGGA